VAAREVVQALLEVLARDGGLAWPVVFDDVVLGTWHPVVSRTLGDRVIVTGNRLAGLVTRSSGGE
jgi:hypothetical protein